MKSVVICSSQRFKDEIKEFVKRLRALGVITVYEPNFDRQKKEFVEKPESERLESKSYRDSVPGMVYAHLDRIDQGDVIFIFNKNGYVGVNTTGEMFYARALRKPIYALEPEKSHREGGEPCREVILTSIAPTAEELVRRLANCRSDIAYMESILEQEKKQHVQQ